MQCFPVVCRLAVTQAVCAEGVVTLRDGAQAEMAAGIVRGRFLAGARLMMKQCRPWCEVFISLFLMKLRLAAQPLPTPEARGLSKKMLSSSLSLLEAEAAAENKIKRYYSVI